MRQRIIIAFRVLFSKKYFFCDGKKYAINGMTTNDAFIMVDVLNNLTEQTINQELLIQEAKELIK